MRSGWTSVIITVDDCSVHVSDPEAPPSEYAPSLPIDQASNKHDKLYTHECPPVARSRDEQTLHSLACVSVVLGLAKNLRRDGEHSGVHTQFGVDPYRKERRATEVGCSVAQTTTISSQNDADAIASCSTFDGSIAIATGTAGGISLEGLERLQGSLTVDSKANLTSISANTLTFIPDILDIDMPGLLNLTGLTNVYNVTLAGLSSYAMDALVSVNGSVGIYDTALERVSFNDLQTTGGNVVLQGDDDVAICSILQFTVIGGGLAVLDTTQLDTI